MEKLNFIEAIGRFYENLQNKLIPKLDDLKKSVSEGKSALASTLTENGVSTAQDATFETINANISTLAETRYSAGAADTKKGTATADKVLEGYTFTSAVAGVEVRGTMKESGSGGVADLPTRLNSLSANPGNKLVTLTLAYSTTSYVSGVQVNWKTGSYPTSPSDGSSMTVSGAATTVKVTGLINKTTYYFRVFLYNTVGGVKYYQTDITNARVTGIPRGVEITGITPLVSAADHIVIVKSGSGTVSLPKGTRIILGSGADAASNVFTPGAGGYVTSITVPEDVDNASFSATVGSKRTANSTKIVIGANTYQCGSSSQVIQSKWGPIGGVGGAGHYLDDSPKTDKSPTAPTGAGGGGGGYYDYDSVTSIKGGNNGGYGNYGGNGGYWTSNSGGSNYKVDATKGASGAAGTAYTGWGLGGGGGGGYAASGGTGTYEDSEDSVHYGSAGSPGAGIIVIEWDA